jgi:hypothetical protein
MLSPLSQVIFITYLVQKISVKLELVVLTWLVLHSTVVHLEIG